MWLWLNETLNQFKESINNKKTFNWFVIVIIGLMISAEDLGVTSIIRALCLNGSTYPLILHFFRSDGLQLDRVVYRWQSIIAKSPLVYRVRGMAVMVADGVKEPKEGRKMPGVKKMHQESENSAKGEYIFGHMFGGVGVIVGDICRKMYCVLVSLRLHDGLGAINGWDENESYKEESHVVKTIRDAGKASLVFGLSLLLLDRLYLTVPMLKTLSMEPLLKVVTKAKLNAKAYYHPKPRAGRGAKAKKGDKIKLVTLFDTMAGSFSTAKALMYGETEKVSYYCENLLWGDGLYQNLRFVLVWIYGKKTILVSTDLSLSPVEIIELYCHRFKIECSFRELKQVVSGFCYRFWSKHMPRLSRFKPNDFHLELQKLITDESARRCIVNTVKAINRFVFMSCIALGLLQMISILFSDKITGKAVRFLRTPSKAVPSEATVADFMRKTIYQLFRFCPDLAITAIIKNCQSEPEEFLFQMEA